MSPRPSRSKYIKGPKLSIGLLVAEVEAGRSVWLAERVWNASAIQNRRFRDLLMACRQGYARLAVLRDPAAEGFG